MTLIIQIAVGVILGIILTKWLSALPHRLRVKCYTRTLLVLSDSDLMRLALEGYEQIFSMPNRNWMIELSFCKDPIKRRDLAVRIANDTADRWSQFGSGRGEGMPPLITSDDRKQLDLVGHKIHDLAETIRRAEKLGVRPPKLEGAVCDTPLFSVQLPSGAEVRPEQEVDRKCKQPREESCSRSDSRQGRNDWLHGD
jgi:hypothetical protein